MRVEDGDVHAPVCCCVRCHLKVRSLYKKVLSVPKVVLTRLFFLKIKFCSNTPITDINIQITNKN